MSIKCNLRLFIFVLLAKILIVQSIAYADNKMFYNVVIEGGNIIISGQGAEKKLSQRILEIKKASSGINN